MKKNNIKTKALFYLTVAVLMLGFIGLSNEIIIHYQLNAREDDAAFLSDKSDKLISQIYSSLSEVGEFHGECNEDELKKIRSISNKYSYVYDIALIKNNAVICSSRNGIMNPGLSLPDPDFEIRKGIYFYSNPLDYTGTDEKIPASRRHNVMVITPPFFYYDRIFTRRKNISITYRKKSGEVFYRVADTQGSGSLSFTGKTTACSDKNNSCVDIVDYTMGIVKLERPLIVIILIAIAALSFLLANIIFNTIYFRRSLEYRLSKSAYRNTLHNHYQPIVDTRDNSIIGVEVLLRWDDEVFGKVSPNLFIPIIEKIGISHHVTLNVIRNALTDLTPILRKYDFFISVNIGSHEISHDLFIYKLNTVVDYFGVNRGRVKLEVTERTDLPYDKIISFVSEIKDNGYLTAIDDFGTGTSNVHMVPDSDFSDVKIDRFFVSRINNIAFFQVVSDMVRFIMIYKKNIIFEGVENNYELEELKKIIEYPIVQGWIYYRPLSKRDLVYALIVNGMKKQREDPVHEGNASN